MKRNHNKNQILNCFDVAWLSWAFFQCNFKLNYRLHFWVMPKRKTKIALSDCIWCATSCRLIRIAIWKYLFSTEQCTRIGLLHFEYSVWNRNCLFSEQWMNYGCFEGKRNCFTTFEYELGVFRMIMSSLTRFLGISNRLNAKNMVNFGFNGCRNSHSD